MAWFFTLLVYQTTGNPLSSPEYSPDWPLPSDCFPPSKPVPHSPLVNLKKQQSFKTFHNPRLVISFKGKKKKKEIICIPKQLKSDSHTMSWHLKTVHVEEQMQPVCLDCSLRHLQAWHDLDPTFEKWFVAWRQQFQVVNLPPNPLYGNHLNLGTYPVLFRHEMGNHSCVFAHYQSHDQQGGERPRNSRQNKDDSGVIFLGFHSGKT